MSRSHQQDTSSATTLLDLPEELIWKIIEYSTPKATISLSFCNIKLSQICRHNKFWRNVNFTSCEDSLSQKQALIVTEFLGPATVCLAMRAKTHFPNGDVLSKKILQIIQMKSPNLHTLELIDWELDASHIAVFPRQLLKLSLAGSRPTEWGQQREYTMSFLRNLDIFLPRLQALNLTRCFWVNSATLLSIRWCKCLREVLLKDCFGVDMYFSMSISKKAFYNLERLDVRGTDLGPRLIETIILDAPNLKELYYGLDLGSEDFSGPLTEAELLRWDEAHRLTSTLLIPKQSVPTTNRSPLMSNRIKYSLVKPACTRSTPYMVPRRKPRTVRTVAEWCQWRVRENFQWEDTSYKKEFYFLGSSSRMIPGEKVSDLYCCQNLRILSATGCSGINDTSLQDFLRCCPENLQLLDLRGTGVKETPRVDILNRNTGEKIIILV